MSAKAYVDVDVVVMMSTSDQLHVGRVMTVRFPLNSRLVEDNLSGTCKNTIEARITTTTIWQWSQDSELWQLQVQNQR